MAERGEALGLAEATAQLTAAGQLFEMEPATVNGVELRVWKHAPATLRDILVGSRRFAERDFLVYEDERTSYAEHFAQAATFAARLVELGVRKGDRVAIAMRNLPEWVVAFWGSIAIGAIVVPLNAWWTSEELHYGLVDSGTSVVVVDLERLGRIRPLLAESDGLDGLHHVIVASEDRGEAVALGPSPARISLHEFGDLLGDVDPGAELPEAELDPDDDATIFYTSGTTGSPKGAVGSHRNVVTNLMNLFFITTRATARFGGGNTEAGQTSRTPTC